MPATPPGLRPGDLLATRGDGWASTMIRLGAAFRDHPNTINHIAIVHHTDDAGTLWCIEGRPGGVGWKDATAYLYAKVKLACPEGDREVTPGQWVDLWVRKDWASRPHT